MDTLIDLVRMEGERFDDRPALIIRPSFRTRTTTYRDLATSVPRAARVLADAGLGVGDRVIIWAVNRPEWGLAFLAVEHAGGVAVPLDVRHTVDFGRKIVDQTEPEARPRVPPDRGVGARHRPAGHPDRDPARPRPARRRRSRPPRSIRDALAEIVFTSGTTGEPKGAMLSHGNLVSCATAMTQVMSFGTKDRLLSVLPLSHLYEQVLGFIGPLMVGASVVYPVSRQPAVLVRTFRDFRISILLIVPQGLQLLTSAIERKVDQAGQRARFEQLHRLARRVPRAHPSPAVPLGPGQFGGRLRLIGVGASALEVDVAERWTDMGVEVLQGYGATEMGPVVTFTRPERNVMGTVGEPIPGVEVRIADDGEILARGPGRFQGYWQNPAATAAAIDAEGWYHTGDLGAFTPDGMLTFRGRKKDMLALPDGQKVYPEDVEAVLRQDDARRRRDRRRMAARRGPARPCRRCCWTTRPRQTTSSGPRTRARATPADPRRHRLAGPGPPADPHAQGPQARGPGPARRPCLAWPGRHPGPARSPTPDQPSTSTRSRPSSPASARSTPRPSSRARASRPTSTSIRCGGSSCSASSRRSSGCSSTMTRSSPMRPSPT